MATISLISVTDWKPPLISRKRMLKLPALDVSVSFKDDDITAYEAVSNFKKLYEAFKKNVEAEFDERFLEFSKKRFEAIQDAIDDVETKLASKSGEEAEKLVEGANVLLRNACLTWQGELAKLGDESVNAALAKFLKGAKKPIIKAKVKCVAKIVLKGLFSVLSGAADVFKDVKAGDAKAAIKDLITKVIIPFGKVAYDEYKSSWPDVQNVCKQIEAHIKELAKALAALAQHDKKYKEGEDVSNLDVLFNEAALRANDLKSQMELLDGLVVEYVGKITEQKKDLEALRKEARDEKVTAVMEACMGKIERASNLLNKITEHQKMIEEMQKQLADHKPPATIEVLTSLVRAIAEGRKGMEALSTVLTALKSLSPKS